MESSEPPAESDNRSQLQRNHRVEFVIAEALDLAMHFEPRSTEFGQSG